LISVFHWIDKYRPINSKSSLNAQWAVALLDAHILFNFECDWSISWGLRLRPGVHDARNWSKILNGERINQSHWSSNRIIQMRLVNPLSVQDPGPISCIVYTRPYYTYCRLGFTISCVPKLLTSKYIFISF